MTKFINIALILCTLCFLQGQKQPSVSAQKAGQPLVIFVGDTQGNSMLEFFRENNTGVPKKIMDRIASENPKCVVHLGDMTFWGASNSRWKEFDNDVSELIKKKIPIYPVMGNHEYMGSNTAALKNAGARFPFLLRCTWYSKHIGPVAILFLNSNDGELTKAQKKEQADWFKAELTRFQNDSSVTSIFAICHHPPYTNSTIVTRNDYILNNFVPGFVKVPKAVAFLSGHCHSYEHFNVGGKHFIVSGGGGGPRQNVKPGAGGKDMPPDLYKGGEIRSFNYCRLIIENGKPKIEVMGFSKETNSFSNIDEIAF